MAALTRGSLPASVYWRRRAAVLGILLLLFIGVTQMFGGGDEEGATARTASAEATKSYAPVVPDNVGAPAEVADAASVAATAAASPTATPTATPTAAATEPATALPQQSTELPTPTGRCSDDDVNVTAQVGKAEATKRVYIALTIKTNVQTACLWTISAKAVQVQITSGSDRIWSTLDCPKAIKTSTLTLRRDTPVQVAVKWNSRRSDDTCSDHTQYAKLGYYHVQVAALGGEPSDVQFRLVKPTVTATATPSASATATATASGKQNPTSKGTRSEPTGSPTVHPD
ncbi:MAG: hypothetical protein QM572_16390 [Nocardioides sp.]|uniref:hypothetical protein n=1 Tax=Nocardioides sp. TaxID=35761 RepID=UPI0039E363A0